MIEIINSPSQESIVLDGNITKVALQSDNGVGHFFRAKIKIDGQIFDEQGWSKFDHVTAVKELLFLYHAYFKPLFNPSFLNSLNEQTHLIKKVTIEIEEKSVTTGNITQQVTLPDFFMMYNVKSALFNHNDKLKLLGVDQSEYKLPKSGKIVLPIYVNASNETFSVTVKQDNGTVLNTQSISNLTGKKVYLYTLDLSTVTIPNEALYLTATIMIGGIAIEKHYKLMRLFNYEPKEIVYQNNFGFYIPVYFDGQLKEDSGFKANSYYEYDGTKKVFEVDESVTYTVNTGSLIKSESRLVNQIANSLDVYLLEDSVYKSMQASIRKHTVKADQQNLVNTSLRLSYKAGTPLYNSESISEILIPTISTTGVKNIAFDIQKSIFEAIYNDGSPLYKIEFLSLPDKSVFMVTDSQGSAPIELGVPYLWSEVLSFRYKGLANEFGSPYTSLNFTLFNDTSPVVSATLIINLTES